MKEVRELNGIILSGISKRALATFFVIALAMAVFSMSWSVYQTSRINAYKYQISSQEQTIEQLRSDKEEMYKYIAELDK